METKPFVTETLSDKAIRDLSFIYCTVQYIYFSQCCSDWYWRYIYNCAYGTIAMETKPFVTETLLDKAIRDLSFIYCTVQYIYFSQCCSDWY